MIKRYRHIFWTFIIALIGTSFHPQYGVTLAMAYAVLNETVDCLQMNRLWSWKKLIADVASIASAVTAYAYSGHLGYLDTVAGLVARYLSWL